MFLFIGSQVIIQGQKRVRNGKSGKLKMERKRGEWNTAKSCLHWEHSLCLSIQFYLCKTSLIPHLFIKYISDRIILKLLKAYTFYQGQFLCDFKHLLHKQYSSEDASSYFKEGSSTIHGAVFVKDCKSQSLFNRDLVPSSWKWKMAFTFSLFVRFFFLKDAFFFFSCNSLNKTTLQLNANIISLQLIQLSLFISLQRGFCSFFYCESKSEVCKIM